MEIVDLVTPQAVYPNLKAGSKKQVLQELSAISAGLTGLEEREIFEVLLGRERLGTTGVGQGVAIPHGKFEKLEKICGVFARTVTPVEFESVDDRPVDLIFLLLVPESAGADHLKALARVSRLMRDVEACEKLRGSDNADALYALLRGSATSAA